MSRITTEREAEREPLPGKAPVMLFDFDRTMLDTGALSAATKEYFDQKYAVWEVPPGSFGQWTKEYTNSIGDRTKFDPTELVEHWYQELLPFTNGAASVSPASLLKEHTAFISDSVAQYLYPDTLETLQRLAQSGCILCLFSQGVETWQNFRLTHTGILQYFAPELQFVTPNKTDRVFLQHIQSVLKNMGVDDRPVWLVDDMPRVLRAVEAAWSETVAAPALKTFLALRDEKATLPDEILRQLADTTVIRDFSPLIAAVDKLVAHQAAIPSSRRSAPAA